MSNKIIFEVRKYFFENPNKTLLEISENFNLPKSTIQNYLTCKSNLNVVKSLNECNLYFLFNGITERKICTEDDGRTVINGYDFSYYEKTFLSTFGFKFYCS